MNRKERVRQFLPFASLRGFDEYLTEMTRETEDRKEMTEDRGEFLTRRIKEIRRGDIVEIIFYETDHYTRQRGEVKSIDLVSRKLRIDDLTISFRDIWDIKPLCSKIKTESSES